MDDEYKNEMARMDKEHQRRMRQLREGASGPSDHSNGDIIAMGTAFIVACLAFILVSLLKASPYWGLLAGGAVIGVVKLVLWGCSRHGHVQRRGPGKIP